MKDLLRLFILVLLACQIGTTASARTLSLYTFHSPPYQVSPDLVTESGQSPFGSTVETVRCVARLMDWETQIRTVPQNRAIHGLQNHVIDGYFAVNESDLLNRFALPTAPVALEKWYFYSLKPIEDFTNARIAAIAGSNEAIWLEQSNYSTAMTVSYPEQLLALLHRNRVDAVLMDQRVMELQYKNGHDPNALYGQFVRFAPLSLYVTLPFATTNPNFLNEFNGHISECLTGGFELSQQELSSLSMTAQGLMDDIADTYDLPGRLSRLGPPPTMEEVLELDQRWQALAPNRASDKAAEILRSQLSGKLAQWQYERHGMVTEIIVMDTKGTNVALSVLTSDYWQGDERKFETIDGTTSNRLYLGQVRFDPSAQAFQVFASMPIYDPGTGKFVGALAVGLNIEKALRSRYLVPKP